MKHLGVYLNFDGNCREALDFYKSTFGGEIKSLQTFGQSPPMPGNTPEMSEKVMHAEFEAEELKFMASDAMGHPSSPSSNITLNISLTDADEQTRIFNNLAEGGRIGMPLGDTFWGARFGMVTDKYNINWMLNMELN